MKIAPTMAPCRDEMRDLDCHGPQGQQPCGSKVEVWCRRCGCHRCAHCTASRERCPMCLVTSQWWRGRTGRTLGRPLVAVDGGKGAR